MNKLYVSALALSLIGGTAMAQSQGNANLRVKKQQVTERSAHHAQPASSSDRAVIWSNDFSDPSTWTIGNINDPNNDNWVIGTTPPGGPPYDIPPIESTTAANGFALFDSNVLCGGTQNAWIRTTDPINLAAYPGVVLTFQEFFRRYQDTCFVETSTDGVTWMSQKINLIASTSYTDNPQTIAVNVSSQIGGASEAWVRFRYKGGCGYAWMVDDVSLVTLPNNELIMDYGYTSQFADGFEYGRVPVSQMPASINVGASVINFGGLQATNVSVTVALTDENNVELATMTSPITPVMANGDTVLFDMTLTPSTPLGVGNYRARFTMTSDQIGDDDDLSNNMRDRYFAVTSDLYSLDGIDVIPDSMLSLTSMGTNSFADNTQDFRLLNYFEVPNTTTFYGVEVYVSSQTVAGSYFIAAVYDTLGVLALVPDLSSPLVESDPRVITDADLTTGGQRASVSFLQPIVLGPGAYYVSANLFQEGGSDIRVIDDETVPQPSIASLIYLPVDANNNFVYTNGTAFAIRLSSQLNVGVQETPSLKGITMYPTPTAGPLEIRSEIPGNMTVQVFNALGAKVLTSSFTGTATTLNLAGNAAGMYTVRIGDGTNFNMQRIVLK